MEKLVLTYAGKLMGYAAYGKVRKEWKRTSERILLRHGIEQIIFL